MNAKNETGLKFSSQTDLHCFSDFYRLNLKRNIGVIRLNLLVVCGIWLVANVLISLYMSNFSTFFLNMGLFVLVLCSGGLVLLYIKRPSRQYEKYPELGATLYEYEFGDTQAAITIKGGAERKKYYEYKTFSNIYETRAGFYFFSSDNLSYLLSKTSMNEESASALSAFLKEKAGQAFIKNK